MKAQKFMAAIQKLHNVTQKTLYTYRNELINYIISTYVAMAI